MTIPYLRYSRNLMPCLHSSLRAKFLAQRLPSQVLPSSCSLERGPAHYAATRTVHHGESRISSKSDLSRELHIADNPAYKKTGNFFTADTRKQQLWNGHCHFVTLHSTVGHYAVSTRFHSTTTTSSSGELPPAEPANGDLSTHASSKYDRMILKLSKPGQFDSMIELLQDVFENKPNEKLCIDTFEKTTGKLHRLSNEGVRKAEESAEHGEQVLQWMIHYHSNGRLLGEPSSDMYTRVLQCWIRSRTPKRAERTEGLVLEMENLFEKNLLPFSADSNHYRVAMSACAKEGDVERVQNLIKKASQKGITDISSGVTLEALAQSGTEDAGEKAEEVLDGQIEGFNSGATEEQPSSYHYGMVVKAYAKSGKPKKAEAMLEKMYKAYLDGNKTARPTVETFNFVLEAWQTWAALNPDGAAAQSDVEQGGAWAEKIMDHMETLHRQGILENPPNCHSYYKLIQMWSALGVWQKADEIYCRMAEATKRGNKSATPNWRIFSTLLQATIQSRNQNAGEKADSILVQIHEFGIKFPGVIYERVLECWKMNPEHPFAELRCAQIEEQLSLLRRK